MSRSPRISALAGITAASLLALTSIGVAAQDDPQPTTVAEVNSGAVTGTVTIDGIALEPKSAGDDEYFFSDGTGITIIDVEGSVPLLDPINIVGQVATDEIDVSSWTPLEAPMENMGPREEAFMAWAALLRDDDMDGTESMRSGFDGHSSSRARLGTGMGSQPPGSALARFS